MPFYEYSCSSCGYEFESFQSIKDKPLTNCDKCGKPTLQKLISASGFRLKGSGWYETDFKKGTDKKTGGEKNLRKYSTPNFLDCIERLAKGLPIHDESPDSKYVVLSPGDLVYVPEEGENSNHIDWSHKRKIADQVYIMKSSSESKCYFLPVNIAALISPYDSMIKKGEFESTNKSERTKATNQLIKENFIKLKVDRLGNVSPIAL